MQKPWVFAFLLIMATPATATELALDALTPIRDMLREQYTWLGTVAAASMADEADTSPDFVLTGRYENGAPGADGQPVYHETERCNDLYNDFDNGRQGDAVWQAVVSEDINGADEYGHWRKAKTFLSRFTLVDRALTFASTVKCAVLLQPTMRGNFSVDFVNATSGSLMTSQTCDLDTMPELYVYNPQLSGEGRFVFSCGDMLWFGGSSAAEIELMEPGGTGGLKRVLGLENHGILTLKDAHSVTLYDVINTGSVVATRGEHVLLNFTNTGTLQATGGVMDLFDSTNLAGGHIALMEYHPDTPERFNLQGLSNAGTVTLSSPSVTLVGVHNSGTMTVNSGDSRATGLVNSGAIIVEAATYIELSFVSNEGGSITINYGVHGKIFLEDGGVAGSCSIPATVIATGFNCTDSTRGHSQDFPPEDTAATPSSRASHVVRTSFIMGGSLSDYGETERSSVRAVLSVATGVTPSAITLEFRAGSVIVSAQIPANSLSAAEQMATTLSTGIMANESTLEAALTAQFQADSASTAQLTVLQLVEAPTATAAAVAVASTYSGAFVAGIMVVLFMPVLLCILWSHRRQICASVATEANGVTERLSMKVRNLTKPGAEKLAKKEEVLDANRDGIIDVDEVMCGVYKDSKGAKSKGLKPRTADRELAKAGSLVKPSVRRGFSAVLGTTVQHVAITANELKTLETTQQSSFEDERKFSVTFQAWRRLNLKTAIFALMFRLVQQGLVVGWEVQQKIEEAGPSSRDCHGSLIYQICDCDENDGRCLFGQTRGVAEHASRCQAYEGQPWYDPAAKVPTGLTSVELNALVEAGFCKPLFGVTPTAAFPLIADRIADSTKVFTYMEIGRSVAIFVCQVVAVVMVLFAWRNWARYKRSRRFVNLAFAATILPPFVVSLALPMRSGVDMPLLRELVCFDVTAYLQDEATGGWLFDLPLGDRDEFCKMDPSGWFAVIRNSIDEGGLVTTYNETTKTVGCAAGWAQKAECLVQCADCFSEIMVTLNGASQLQRNPCLDVLTFDRICGGRDDIAQSMWGSLPSHLRNESTRDAVIASFQLGGYGDPSSLCPVIQDSLGSGADDCRLKCFGTQFPGGDGRGSNINCAEKCSSVFMGDLLGTQVVTKDFIPDACATKAMMDTVLEIATIGDIWEAVEVGVGIMVSVQTVLSLGPAGLSLILGLLKAVRCTLLAPPPSSHRAP